ncbi:hypothetical protein MASR1M74_22530 [Lentimicrobium sp.]
MRIAIYSEFPFPIGSSGTNRLISYSRGLVELGNSLHVFIGKPTENLNQTFNNQNKGNFKGIKYTYPTKKIIKSKHKIIRVLEIFIGLIFTIKNICNEHKANAFDALLISNDYPGKVFCISLLAKLLKITKCILIVDEFPIPIRYGKNDIPKFSFLLYKNSFRRINALFSMTHALNEYYTNNFNVKKSLIVPMTVENDRFENIIIDNKHNYLAYIGNLEIVKDGVDILIEAFSIILKDFPDIKLKLYGGGSQKETLILKEMSEKLNIANNVVFEGRIDRDKVPSVLCNARALLLPRPSSKRADGGFPTKLGEYLASGVPAVVTSVGEISLYLDDGVNVYIVEPDSAELFAKKVLFVLKNPEHAKKVGLKGKELALEKFNYFNQARDMANFISHLK